MQSIDMTLRKAIIPASQQARLFDRELVGDEEAEAFEAVEFFRVVGEDAELGEAEVAEDLGADAEVAAVHQGVMSDEG
jgi:hypothetical protein